MTRSVTLVDVFGESVGDMEVVAAHTAPGFLHLACSAVVFGPENTVLLQRRADDKPTFGGKWSNTCCTHPFAGETPIAAATRRTLEELGISVALSPAGTFRYRAVDSLTGMVEHEVDHVSIATVDSAELAFALDPSEVAEVAFVPLDILATLDLTPWFAMVMHIALSARGA
jgi:isopentenyl-diphosphate Delta-isomerase